jgi:hypothetical protein
MNVVWFILGALFWSVVFQSPVLFIALMAIGCCILVFTLAKTIISFLLH